MVTANTTEEARMKGVICPKCGGTDMVRNGAYHGKQQWKCRTCKHRTLNPRQDGTPPVEMATDLPDGERFLVTCAQNVTPVHPRFWQSLLHCAAHLKARLIVIPIRYKNPTSIFTEFDKIEDDWVPEVKPYLFEGRDLLHEQLIVLADIKTQATAVRPTTGWEGISGSRSAIIGHPKLEMRVVPMMSELPKIIVTTGSCTKRNYTDSRAGKRADFHHTFGACLVEKDGDRFHIRQINALEDGTFIDLRKKYTPKGVEDAGPAEALIMGDTHVDVVDPDVVKATFEGPGSIARIMQPKRLIWHDLMDGATVNPHTRGNPFNRTTRHKAGLTDVKAELERCAAFIDKYSSKGVENIVADSNHDDFLNRWMKSTDWREDPENAELFLETALVMLQTAHIGPGGLSCQDPFAYWMKQLCKTPITFGDPRGGISVKGVEVSMHGHRGANGARGSLLGYSKLGVKSVIGHSHVPGIIEGAYQVGTSSHLKLEYNYGPSSWLNTHCIIYPNGKRTLVNIIKGTWRRGRK
jgi:hypothetical protein